MLYVCTCSLTLKKFAMIITNIINPILQLRRGDNNKYPASLKDYVRNVQHLFYILSTKILSFGDGVVWLRVGSVMH